MKETHDQQHARVQTERRKPVTLAQIIKSSYPGEYDDRSDLELEQIVRESYPGEYDHYPRTNNAALLPKKPIEVAPEPVDHNIFAQPLSTSAGQAWTGLKNVVGETASAVGDAVSNASPSSILNAVKAAPGAILDARNHIANTIFEGTPDIENTIAKETAQAQANPSQDGILDQARRGALRVTSHVPLFGPTVAGIGEAFASADPEQMGRQVPAMIELAALSPTARAGAAAAGRGAVRGAKATTRAAGNFAQNHADTLGTVIGTAAGAASGGPAGAFWGGMAGGNPAVKQGIRQFGKWFGDPPAPKPPPGPRGARGPAAPPKPKPPKGSRVADPREADIAGDIEDTLASTIDDMPNRGPHPDVDETAIRQAMDEHLANREAQAPRAERRSADKITEGLTNTPSRPESQFPPPKPPGLRDPDGVGMTVDDAATEAVDDLRAAPAQQGGELDPALPKGQPLTTDTIPGYAGLSEGDQAYWQAFIEWQKKTPAERRMDALTAKNAGKTPFMVTKPTTPAPAAPVAEVPVTPAPVPRTTTSTAWAPGKVDTPPVTVQTRPTTPQARPAGPVTPEPDVPPPVTPDSPPVSEADAALAEARRYTSQPKAETPRAKTAEEIFQESRATPTRTSAPAETAPEDLNIPRSRSRRADKHGLTPDDHEVMRTAFKDDPNISPAALRDRVLSARETREQGHIATAAKAKETAPAVVDTSKADVTIKRAKDYRETGNHAVTFKDGRDFRVYYDRQSGQWYANGIEDSSHGRGLSREDLVNRLRNLDESQPFVSTYSGIKDGKTLGEHLASSRKDWKR